MGLESYRPFELPAFWGRDYLDASPSEARRSFKWFLEQVPLRLDEIKRQIMPARHKRESVTLTRELLTDVEQLLRETVQRREMTPEELLEIQQLPKWFQPHAPRQRLDNLSLSLCIDAGIFFGEAMRSHLPQLQWAMVYKPKNDVEYHHPVLGPFKNTMQLNPIRIAAVVSQKISEGRAPDGELIRTFDIWTDLAN